MRIFRRFLVAVLVAVLVLPYLIMPTHGLLAMEGTVFEEDYLEIGGIGARVSMSVSGDVWNGGYADITIFLDSNPGMFGFVVDLLFDDTKLVPVSIFGGNLRDFQVVSSPVDGGIYHGRLKFLAHGAELSNETGAIATARFRVIDDIYWEIPISIESLDAVVDDGFGGIIELSVSAHGEALPQQGIQAFEQASVVGLLGFRFGDANGDGRVTSADGTVIARYLVGHDVAINRRGADVNADGVISDDDRNFLAGALVGRYPRLGPPPNSLTIVPYCSLGFPVYRAEIELFVDGVRTVHQTQTGVIAIRDIPDGSSVQFNVTSEYGGFSSAEIGSFNYYFDGVQVVTLEEEEPVSMPYIRVLTEFPSGTVHLPFMDIEYMVAPGDGADILTVSYSINGRHHNYIYWHGNAVLGQARVFITPGRNELAFTVRDSRGREAVYVVENVPYFQSGLSAGRAPIEYNRPSVRHEGEYFVNNRIRLGAFVQNNPASHEEIVEIINSMGGVIIGYSRTVSCFTVQVPEDDEAGLLALGESFIELFPHIFDFSGISGGFIDPRDAFACECCIFRDDLVNAFGEPLEPWTREERRAIIEARLAELAEGGDSDSFQESFRASRISLPPVQLPPAESPGGSSFHCPRTSVFSRFYQTAPTNDPFWHSSNPHYQWGLRDSFLSHAWDFSGYQERQNIKVGIIDQPVRHTHEDLNIPSANTSSVVLPISDFHGTMVMGIIGAEHDNGRGLAGGINIARENLFAYDIRRGNFYYGLRWNVERGTRVVNISMILSRDSRNDILRQMQNLLYVGYDFIIVQAAGNASADTNRDNSGSIAYGASQELRDRIITVGNLAPRPSEGECDDDWTRIHYSSNWGALVDVFAPGHNTYSAFSRYPWYMLNGGTSSAAPFVSSLAALIWDEHPDFSGTQVKQIIVDSAQGEYGETVVDTRRTQGGTYHAINALAAMKLAYRATPEHISGRFVGRVVSAAPYSNAYFPVRNAEVRIYRIEREVNRREWYRRVVETDAQGFFSAKNLFPGNYEFFVYAPRYVQVDVPFIHIPAGVTTQRVTLPMVAQTQVATGNVGGTLVMATPQPEDFAVSNFTSLSDTVTIPFNGRATMQFIRGIYFIEPYMLECAEWMEFLDFNVVKTVEVTDGHFHAQLPPGNYTVIVSGAVIYTEIAHVISHWDGDDYWLKQDINIRINPNLNVIWGTDGDDEIIVASTNRRSYFVFPLGGNDVITVNGSGNNTIYATIGNNEILITGSGYNTVYGSLNGNDTIRTESSSSRSRIDPGLGNNTIVAGTGHDTFVIGRGYGFNRITANSSSSISRDRLVLKDGIRPDEVYFVRDGNNLEIYIWEKPAIMAFGMSTIHLLPMELVCENAIEEFREIFENITNRITFVDFFRATRHRIIDITFDDGTVFPLSYLMELRGVVYGTDGDDEINVSSPGINSIFPLGGNDIINISGGGNNTIHSSRGNDTITIAGSGTNFIYATGGSNTILITGGSTNVIYGSLNGNDTIRTESSSSRSRIDPGLGDNTIVAGTGHDTFVIGRGYGFNRITANSSSSTNPRDRLVLKDGIRPDEVYFVRDGNNLEIYIWERPAIMAFGMGTIHLLPMELVCENAIAEFREIFENITNRITFVDFFRATRHRIIDITFDDGTVFPLSYLMELRGVVYGTDGDDEINVSSPGVNTIFPMGGNDIITVGGDGTNTIYATRGSNKIFITGRSANTVYGSLDGNDIIVATGTGRNIIDPGFGDNVIYAGTGSDTFIIGRGYGINRITANGGFDITRPRDRLVLKDGIRPAEVRLARYDRDLVVRIVDNSLSPSRTTFIGFFSGGVRRRLTDITFDCGTVFTTADIISIANDNRVTESPSVYIDEISEFYTYAVEGDGSTPSSPCDDTNAIS